MKVKIQGFLGQLHSWAIVNQNIAREFIRRGHEVHLISTDGLKHLPPDLVPFIRSQPDRDYDFQCSYTAPVNFSNYLSYGSKNKFGIWVYEFRGSLDNNNVRIPTFPQGFTRYCSFPDKILAPSSFARDIFLDNKVPEHKVTVIPHGINLEEYESKEIYPVQTKRKYKILANIAQPHLRKNLPGLFEAYGRAFKKNNDDVCLVCKVYLDNKKKDSSSFDVNFWDILNDFKKKYPNHAPVEVINKFIPNITTLYNACDIVFTMSLAEGFYMPGLEAMCLNKINIAPNYGGQLDFMNNQNSLLINGKEIRADKRMQYWNSNVQAVVFEPDVDCAAEKLKNAVKNYDVLLNEYKLSMQQIKIQYSWKNVVDKIMNLI